jgi:hypothetical protein
MRKTSRAIPEKILEPLLLSHERTIRHVQAATGYDAYWRWYFRLAGGGA